MKAFSRPKRVSKFEAGESTELERAKAQVNTKRMYPRMFEEGWGKPAKRKADIAADKKDFTTARTEAVTEKLKTAGLTDEEIKKLRGK